ncbi:MAG: DUF1249 domain-containing protein [Pseudomonadales bacterium]|jgi:uncharacterized protein YqiB (DUF1249 family)|nr:DUF1249 domain-containing protein [Pseudomonadales bacterium]
MARARYRVNLARQMATCDANYARMHQLLPELFDRDLRSVALPLPGDSGRELLFSVIERCPYTTTVLVHFERAGGDWHAMIPAPRLSVRLYHDCRTAEVLAYQGEDRFDSRYDYPNARMRQPDEKVQLNLFLAEYLALCLDQGREVARVATDGRS